MLEEQRQPIWTFIFIAISVLTYFIQSGSRFWIYLAFTPALAAIYPWTLITAIFIHLDFNHLFFNMLALLVLGSLLERKIDNRIYAAIFILSGVVGNLGYYFTSSNPYSPVLGASGAIYGVIGVLAILEPFRLVYVYGLMPLPMIVTAILWALGDIMGLFVPSQIAHGVHLISMLVGIIAGLYLRGKDRTDHY